MDALINKTALKRSISAYLRLLAAALVAGVLYSVITLMINRYVPDSGYLSDAYNCWFENNNVLLAFFMALANVVRISFAIPIMGHSVYGGAAICVTTLAFIAVIARFIWTLSLQLKLLVLLIIAIACASPFAIFIALGTFRTPGRALLGLALLGAAQWLLVLNAPFFTKARKLKFLLAAVVLVYNLISMNQLFYNSGKVYEADKQTARNIISDIEEAGIEWENRPVVFLGMHDSAVVEPDMASGSTGGSFFSWDDGNITRMVNFIRAEGYPVEFPSQPQIKKAVEISRSMAFWPDEGSIKNMDGFVAVSLSPLTERWYKVNGVIPLAYPQP
jgi:hypothetical protein